MSTSRSVRPGLLTIVIVGLMLGATPGLASGPIRWTVDPGDWVFWRNDLLGSNLPVRTSNLGEAPALLWRTDLRCQVRASPIFADADGDGRKEVLVADRCGNLHLLDARTGAREAEIFVGSGNSVQSATVGDFDNDGRPEIALLAWDGLLRVYNGEDLKPLWSPVFIAGYDGGRSSGVAYAELDNDGKWEIVVGGSSVNGESGSWFRTLGTNVMARDGSMVIANTRGSSHPEVYAFDSNCFLRGFEPVSNSVLFGNSLGCPNMFWRWPSPTLADLEGDGKLEVLMVGANHRLHVFAAEGQTLSVRGLHPGTYEGGPVVADLEGDGRREIIMAGGAFGNVGSKLQVTNATSGAELWTYTLTHSGAFHHFLTTPLVLDTDHDGTAEIVVAGSDRRLYAFHNPDKKVVGLVKWAFATGGNVFSDPIAVDLDGNGGAEIVFGADDGFVYAIASGPVEGAPAPGSERTPPTTTASLDGPHGLAGWHLGDVQVTLVARDEGSGVAQTRYRVDDGPVMVYKGPFLVAGDGAHEVRYHSVDFAGNVEGERLAEVRIDSTPPGTTDDAPATRWLTTSPVTFRLAARDATSGVATTVHAVDGADVREGTVVTVQGEGVHSVIYRSRDVAGNQEPLREARVGIDTSPPATTATPSGALGKGGWWRSVVTVALDATDAASGVAATEAGVDGAALAPYAGPFALDEDGDHLVRFRSRDAAGHVEAVRTLRVAIDTTPPQTLPLLDGVPGQRGWHRSDVAVTLGCSDAASGCAATRYRVDEGPWTPYAGPFLVRGDGTHRVAFGSTDLAGNAEEPLAITVRIDATPPRHALLAPRPGHLYANDLEVLPLATGDTVLLGEQQFRAEAFDDTAGVDRVEFWVDGALVVEDRDAPYAWPFAAAEHSLRAGDRSLAIVAWDRAGNAARLGFEASTVPTDPQGLTATAAERSPPPEGAVLPGADADADGVPATLRAWNPLARGYQELALDPDDHDASTPAARWVEATVPREAVPGPDGDLDLVPASMTFKTTLVRLDRVTGEVATRGGPPVVVAVDPDDADPYNPAARGASAAVPSDVALGPDEDGDLLPASVTVRTQVVHVDRVTGEVLVGAGGDLTVALDPDDHDPAAPVATAVSATVPTDVALGPDADGDLVPAHLVVRTSTVTVDRGTGEVTTAAAGDLHLPLDPDDGNPASPLPMEVAAELPSGATLGPDGDDDGIPATLTVETTRYAWSRADPGALVPVGPGAPLVLVLDPDDPAAGG